VADTSFSALPGVTWQTFPSSMTLTLSPMLFAVPCPTGEVSARPDLWMRLSHGNAGAMCSMELDEH
jgi:hypothetical protein